MIAAGVSIVLVITGLVVRRITRPWYTEAPAQVSRTTLAKINQLYPHGQ